MTSGFKKLVCRLLGHDYQCSILEEVGGQLWATKEQCVRCGHAKPNTYYPVAKLNMMEVINFSDITKIDPLVREIEQ